MCGLWQVHVLVCDAVEGAVVIEAKVARVDDVVCPSICSELVERLQVSCLPLAGRSRCNIRRVSHLARQQCRALVRCLAESRGLGWGAAGQRRGQALMDRLHWGDSCPGMGAVDWELARGSQRHVGRGWPARPAGGDTY
jgi:hypothetical protein